MTVLRASDASGTFLPVDPMAMRLVEAFDTVRNATGATAVARVKFVSGKVEVALARSFPDLVKPGDQLTLPPEFLPEASSNRNGLHNIRAASSDADQYSMGTGVFVKYWKGAKAAVVENSSFTFSPVRAVAMAQIDESDAIVLLSLKVPKVDLAGTAGMVAVLARFASAADSLANDLAKLRSRADTFESAAAEDPLTGLANRAGFRNAMAIEQRRRIRYPGNTTIMMMDLDGLKSINDRLGHAAGDEMIVRAAQVLRQTCRTTDIVARLGGDEFAILAPETDAIGADILLRRLKESLGYCSISASIGSASTYGVDSNLQTLLANADQLMYDEKRRHRGQAGPTTRAV